MQYLTNRVKRIEKSLKPEAEFRTFLRRVMNLIAQGNAVIPSRDRFDDDAFQQLCNRFPEQARELSRQMYELKKQNRE